ncbi:hypothetical protein GOP47_0020411 [Adiantum capillus-veneris]|uniref:Uncharacterized protein n=1 Tax=Adiantum capillus-veneris TaxID=13818 RepID=A0A9D4UEG6_ADICA|nr:hypothetical protein GOP47_0020411 [Adiantum capillus-veneris]
MKKKMEAGLLQSTIAAASGPKLKLMDEHQEVKAPFLDMNLIKACEIDARLAEVEQVPTRSYKIQRGIFRMPPSFLAQEDEVIKGLEEEVSVPEPATGKTVVVQESTSSEEGSESSQSSNNSLDTNATWETKSMSSRYETYDAFHVDEVMKDVYKFPASELKVREKNSASAEMLCVNLLVEQPSLVSCGGESLLAEEVWFDCACDLIEDQVFEDDLQELEREAKVSRSDLSMQGVGQSCLDGHVEVHSVVLEFACSCGEIAPTDDSMEIDTGATYKSEAPCKEENAANLVGDEVFEEQDEA